jgi:streptogramin lyase
MPGRRPLLALVVLVVCLGAGSRPAVAATPGESVFPISGCYGGRFVPAVGEGIVFPACEGKSRRLATSLTHLKPDGTTTSIGIPPMAIGAMAAGPDGEVWLAGRLDEAESSVVERVGAEGDVRSYPSRLPAIQGLTVDAEGAAWVAIGEPTYYTSGGGELRRISPDGSEAGFRLPRGLEPRGLVVGTDGNIWFTAVAGSFFTEHTTDLGKGFVGRMSPAGEFALFPTPVRESGPSSIVQRPGGKLLFIENGTGSVGKIASNGVFGPSHRILPGGPFELTIAPNGDLWIADGRGGLIHVTHSGRQVRFNRYVETVTIGPEGDVWAGAYGKARRAAA